MGLLDLPNELLQDISDSLKLERDINAFTRTNRRLYNLLNQYLYRYNVQFFGSSALPWAAECGQAGTAQKLLGAGADANTPNKYGDTPLILAIKNGHMAIVELLLAEDGLNPDSKANFNRTPLSWAAEMGNEVVVKWLLSSDKVDPDSIDRNGRTPLSWAAQGGK